MMASFIPDSRVAVAAADHRHPQARILPARDHRFHVLHWPGRDDGPLRVILHGWLDVAATWQRLVDHLPAAWHIAAPDQRGFGHSDWIGDTYWFYDYVGDLDALLDQLSPDTPVDLIGHSMGSQVAALYAGVRPERVRRLVVLDGFYLPASDPSKAPRQIARWLNELKDRKAPREYSSLDDLAQRIGKRQPGLDAEGARFVASCWSEPLGDGRYRLLGDPRHRQHGPLLYRDEEAKAIFSEITARTLIVDAEKSNLASATRESHRRARLDCFRDRVERTLAGAGHMLHFDAPQACAEAITEFLEEGAAP